MRKHVLILGAGFGGLELATRLSETLQDAVRVTLLDRDNRIVQHLGDSNAPAWNNPLRTQPRESFVPGQFICPHGACFDRDGNIFVVEWVEVGRVTKLRRVSG